MKKLWLLLAIAVPLQFIYAQEVHHDSTSTHLLGDPTGNDYLRVCEAAVNNPPSGHYLECGIWFSAVLSGFKAMAAEKVAPVLVEGPKSLPYSIPDEVTTGQIEKVVVKYMNDHPKDLDNFASLLVLYALVDAYPPRPSPTKK